MLMDQCARKRTAPMGAGARGSLPLVNACKLARSRGARNISTYFKLFGFRACAAAQEPVFMDVSGVVVQPAYRMVPISMDQAQQPAQAVRILLVSESNVCRSLLAEALLQKMLQDAGLAGLVHVESRASRDYCLGEGPPGSVRAVARQLGLELPLSRQGAQLLRCPEDIGTADMLLVMDKFTAADVLREVSSYDLIQPGARYSSRVRRLGEFHPQLASISSPDGQDIEDALYGNFGGAQEEAAVAAAAAVIADSCRGVVQLLLELRVELACGGTAAGGRSEGTASTAGGGALQARSGGECADAAALGQQGSAAAADGAGISVLLRQRLASMGSIDWLVPPLLQGHMDSPFV